MAGRRKKFRSDALAAAHDAAEGLYRAGIVDKRKMRELDAFCLTMAETIDEGLAQAERGELISGEESRRRTRGVRSRLPRQGK